MWLLVETPYMEFPRFALLLCVCACMGGCYGICGCSQQVCASG